MSQLLTTKHKGLYTSPNEFSEVPEGALVRANNVVITVNGIIEPRRGQDRVFILPNADDRITRYTSFQDKLLASWNGTTVGYENTTTFTAIAGTYSHPDSNLARTRFLPSNSNLYFNTAAGVYKMSTYNGTAALAGVPKGLDIQATASGATGFLATANQTAYRVIWGIRDSNNKIQYGAPSGRTVLINAGGTSVDVALVITIPSGITTSHFLQVYRSKASGGAAVLPDDELQLVYENNPTAGELVTGTLSITDRTTDDLRGASLYTNPSQKGIAKAKERPPQADYIGEFEDCAIYGNIKSKHRKTFTLLGTGGSALVADDTITIAGVVYTAKAAETIASGQFKVFSGGTPSQDIYDTAISLVRVINRYASNTLVYAYYLSGPVDLPGAILIEERGIGGAAFTIASSRGTAFNPNLTTAVTSQNDDLQNVIMISEKLEPEAVPLGNLRFVGSANTPIRGIAKLKNSCFIFKEREGIYRLTGTSPDTMEVELFDSSAKLIAPDSIAVVNNQIWCLCDQGIAVVTETGVSVISRPIEDLILDQFGTALDQVRYYSHGVGYESERQYILFTVSSSSDTVATQALVFNIFTNAYTRWPMSKSAAIVNPVDDKLYLADGASYNTSKERKSRTFSDYVDHGLSYTVTSSTLRQVFLSTTSEIEVGDLLYQSASVNSLITAVEPAYVTVLDLLTWANGATTVYKAYECEVEYSALSGANPGMEKQFPEIATIFKAARFNAATLSFATEVSNYFEGTEIAGSRSGGWGIGPWGEFPWGGATITHSIRALVPLEKQRAAWLRVRFTLREGYGYFKLLGISVPALDSGSYAVGK